MLVGRVTRDADGRRARRDACAGRDARAGGDAVCGCARRGTNRLLARGASVAYAPPMLTLAAAVQEQARLRPDAIALVSSATGTRLTYAALAQRGAHLARVLARGHGVRHGDRVAVLAHNDVRTFEMLLACSRLGAALAPLNVRLSDDELDAVLAQCEPRVLFVDDAHASRTPGYRGPREPLAGDMLEGEGDGEDTIAGSLDDTLVLLFTSGTTGKPKGAMLPQRSIAANAGSTRRAWALSDRDVALVDAPLFHTGGLNVLATPLFYAGGTVIVAPRFDATASGEILVREGCTVAFGVPTMIERLFASGVVDRSRIRLFVTGGAPCPRTLLDAFVAKGVSLVQGFGMTECGPNCFRPIDSAALGSVGTPTFGLEARLVGDDGRDVATGDPGELLLRGPHVFAGYFRDESATRAALDDDGWLHTGDVLRATPDGWFVAGRKKEMFISGGENVYPAEVEAAFTLHASIAEAAVVSIPDATWGEAGVGWVLARAGTPEPSPDDVRAFLRERIAAYKVPRAIYVEHDLPRTASGKIDKRELTERALARRA
ncbi:MAG: AMP-dependent synthetase and ligase [Myxococcaceae bacterium]|nr:AMP-dependent synthetase and ligase [Myxococcaceae bacterium]